MKKLISLILVAFLLATLFVGCGGQQPSASSDTKSTQQASVSQANQDDTKKANAEPVTIKWFQFQIEVAEQVKNLAKKYEAENPNVKVEAEVMGEGYFDVLKTRAASGDMPDIFMTKGYAYLGTYKDFIEDLSAEPLAQKVVDAAKPCISLDGKILGLPVQMGGWGIVYNKKIFQDNGLQIPKTISELKKVCEALKAKGITPFVDQYKDAWMLGHLTGAGYGRASEPTKFIQNLNAGTAKLKDSPEMKADMDFLDLTLQYGQANPLSTDMNTACTLMGQGKAAMMPEGNWVYDTITKVDPNIQLGMFAVPTTDNASQTKFSADVNGVWHVSSQSKNKAEAKKILNWIVDSQAGKDFVTKDCKFIPAFKGLKSDLNSIGQDIAANIDSGNTSIWGWVDAPDGYENDSGAVMQDYIGKKLNRDQTLEKLDTIWAKGIAKK